MPLHQPSHVKLSPNSQSHSIASSVSASAMSDDTVAESDEPPNDSRKNTTTSGFTKRQVATSRQPSLLTQLIHTSESESQDDENMFSDAKRAHSSASNWSVCSTAELTSDGHNSPERPRSPSPPLPTVDFKTLPAIFNTKPFTFDGPPAVLRINSAEILGPLQKQTPSANADQTFEQGLGRKRCISFACGAKKQDEAKKADVEQAAEAKLPEIVAKRPCTLKWGNCARPPQTQTSADQHTPVLAVVQQQAQVPTKRPTALSFACPSNATATLDDKTSKPVRAVSPAPKALKAALSPRVVNRVHRGSDSTVRNESPKSVRKVPSLIRARRMSNDSEVDRNEQTRFHEFMSSDEEQDDWIQEATVHRSRLTIDDTLKVENNLRQLAEEDEDEDDEDDDMLDDEDDVIMADDDDDDDDDEDEHDVDDELEAAVDSAGYSSDEGFDSDDERDACSDNENESDAGSDYAWWAPGLANPSEPIEHIRPVQRRTSSASSIESMTGNLNGTANIDVPQMRYSPRMHKHRPRPNGRPTTPELPDSTDFVCGTLDEDRPLEEAYFEALKKRREAKRKLVPQDIDPSFPTSDPEMDEEDEDDDLGDEASASDHPFMHGHDMDLGDDFEGDATPAAETRPRSMLPKKRSPSTSPTKRLRSPPPTKRAMHRSPPPPTRRALSPAPMKRARSPAPISRKSSVVATNASKTAVKIPMIGPVRPRLTRVSSSLPRSGFDSARQSLNPSSDMCPLDDDNMNDSSRRTRGAIDIVKGLERKRERRQLKLYERYCKQKAKKPEAKKPLQPGKGCEKMKLVGEGLNAYRGKPIVGVSDPKSQPVVDVSSFAPEVFCPFDIESTATSSVAIDLEGMHILSV